MKTVKFAATLLCAASLAFAQADAQADNTKKNKRDRNDHAVTADQQGGSASDRELTRKIRKAVIDDKSLSTYARNVKIISQGGKVILRGPVNSEAEKRTVESLAATAAGEANVTSKIEIMKKEKE